MYEMPPTRQDSKNNFIWSCPPFQEVGGAIQKHYTSLTRVRTKKLRQSHSNFCSCWYFHYVGLAISSNCRCRWRKEATCAGNRFSNANQRENKQLISYAARIVYLQVGSRRSISVRISIPPWRVMVKPAKMAVRLHHSALHSRGEKKKSRGC